MPNGKKLSLVIRAEADEAADLIQALTRIMHDIGNGKPDGWDANSYMYYITTKEPKP